VSPVTGMKLRPGSELGFYLADAIFADFDNDGWKDLVVCNRSERHAVDGLAANMLFMNNGDGTFRPTKLDFSGINSVSICGEAADLNGDGLLDLVFAADPGNSIALAHQTVTDIAPERFESKVYWNNGEHGAKANHWLHLTFTGLKDAELIGARVELTSDGKMQHRWIHTNHSYKSGGALDAHFGLGQATSADVKVTLLNGRTQTFEKLTADKSHPLKLSQP